MNNRIKLQCDVSTALACMTDQHLASLLADASPGHSGIGGSSCILSVENTPVFVKRIALSMFELQPETTRATANIFGLPLWFQYDINGRENWRDALIRFPTAAKSDLPTHCREIVERYRDVTLALLNFRDELKLAPDSTKYPAEKMERLLGNAVVV